MEPIILSLLGQGLATAFTKLLEKGIVDPALDKGLEPLRKWLGRGYDQAQDEAVLRKAVDAAIESTSGTRNADQWAQFRWVTALDEIKAKPGIAKRIAAAAIEMVSKDPNDVPPDLITELKIGDQRTLFAEFLFNLRRALAIHPIYGGAIDYANAIHVNHRLNGLYEIIAAVAEAEHQVSLRANGDVMIGGDVVGRDKVTNVYFSSQSTAVSHESLDFLALERPYLEDAMNDFARLSLESRAKDEAVAGRTNNPIQLEQIYIALNTNEMRKATSNVRQPLSALKAVSESRHLVLLGDPGSGKSTFARHLCLCLAGARMRTEWLSRLVSPDLDRWPLPAYLPIFVRLRDFASDLSYLPADPAQHGEARHILAYIKQELLSSFSDKLVEHIQVLLEKGDALLVLDGLDEITHPKRAETPENMPQADDRRRVQVAQAILDFSQVRFRHARVLTTCRIRQYQSEDNRPRSWHLNGFPIYTLSDFDAQQIEAFVTNWFGALAGQIMNADEKRDSLLTALREQIELADLAPRPIILTQMSLVHANRKLPDSRVDLYRECSDLLLWEWERLRTLQRGRQGLSADDFLKELAIPSLRRDDVEAALYAAVAADHASGFPEIQEETLLRHLTSILVNHGLSKYTAIGSAQKIIDEWLRMRNGLLIPARGDTFDLPHRSFREFMAARVLVEQGYRASPDADEERWYEVGPRLASENLSLWREVLRFAAALEARRIRDVAYAVDTLWPESIDLTPENAAEIILAGEMVRDVGPAKFRERRVRSVYDRIEHTLINLCRDTTGGPYPNDKPNIPPTPHLAPETRLQAGHLLSDFGWTPLDLDEIIPVNVGKEAIYIGKYPVTNLQYARYLNAADYADETLWRSLTIFDSDEQQQLSIGDEAWNWFVQSGGKNRLPGFWHQHRLGFNRRLFPVVGVTWYEAGAYCAWLTRHWQEQITSQSLPRKLKFRLPLSSEIGTIRGGYGLSWLEELAHLTKEGMVDSDVLAKVNINISPKGFDGPTPVFMYPGAASMSAGVVDIFGNVFEWQAVKDKFTWDTGQRTQHTFRTAGTSWAGDLVGRYKPVPPDTADNDLGFRIMASRTD